MAADQAHPRVSVSGLCFPGLSAVDSIGVIGSLGVGATSMVSGKLLDSGVDAVLDAGRRHGVEVVTTTALARLDLRSGADNGANLKRAREDIDRAAGVGAGSVYTLTGPRAFPEWRQNVDAYAAGVASLIDYTAGRGVGLAVEPTSWLYADLNFVHGFHDAIAFARQVGMTICLDLFHVWTESELRGDIERNIDLVAHVQLSDLQRGARSLPCRAVPGDGDVPLREMIGWLLGAGYGGPFDLELSGPSIDEIGDVPAAQRSVRWLSGVLDEMGA